MANCGQAFGLIYWCHVLVLECVLLSYSTSSWHIDGLLWFHFVCCCIIQFLEADVWVIVQTGFTEGIKQHFDISLDSYIGDCISLYKYTFTNCHQAMIVNYQLYNKTTINQPFNYPRANPNEIRYHNHISNHISNISKATKQISTNQEQAD